MRHLFAYKNHTYPFYIPGNIEGENSLYMNLHYKGIKLSGNNVPRLNKEKTLGNVLKRLKDKGKLLMLKRYYPNSGKQFSTVFMPYPTIFLQPAFIPMLRIKFGNEKLDKDQLSENYFKSSIRSLNYKLQFQPGNSAIRYQQVADQISDSIWVASTKHLTLNKNLRYNKNHISKQLFHIRDIFYKEEMKENIKTFRNRND
ncbi:MAG: hypothetical protein CMF96_00940 [Candidatus Marinimicrobia bacterium]|nr:hypothetical protein [Candidatus Neomarinimicrobiota bacterium]